MPASTKSSDMTFSRWAGEHIQESTTSSSSRMPAAMFSPRKPSPYPTRSIRSNGLERSLPMWDTKSFSAMSSECCLALVTRSRLISSGRLGSVSSGANSAMAQPREPYELRNAAGSIRTVFIHRCTLRSLGVGTPASGSP